MKPGNAGELSGLRPSGRANHQRPRPRCCHLCWQLGCHFADRPPVERELKYNLLFANAFAASGSSCAVPALVHAIIELNMRLIVLKWPVLRSKAATRQNNKVV